MNDELAARHRAITLRLAGRPVKAICCRCRPLRGLVPQVVAPLPGGRPRGPLRPDPGQPPRRPAHLARAGAGHPLHPPPAPGPCLAGHPLQPDRGRGHPRRTEGPGHPPAPLRAHHRARPAAQRLDRAAGPPRPAAATPGVPRPAGPGLQRTPRGRSRGADLPQGQRPPLLHLGGQGRLRRRRLPAPGRLPPHGRGPRVPRRVLEGPGPAGAGPARQRPRAVRLGAGGAHPVAGDPALPALRRQPGVHPGRGAAVQRQRGELQRLVPGAAVPADASTGRATCGGSWRGCRRRSTRSTSTRGWGARRRRSTAGACGCRSCPRASWCRRGGCRWRRGA